MKLRINIAVVMALASVIFYASMALAQTQAKDSDYDGLSDQVETNQYHTDPAKADTDQDGFLDAAEVLAGSDPANAQSPSAQLDQTNAIGEKLAWYVSRSAAVAAYILMFLIIVLGTGMTMGFAYKLFNPVRAWAIHQYLGIALGLMIMLHVFSLLFDRFMGFKALDLFVPFYSGFKPLFLSAGIVAFYLLVSVLATSLILRNRKPAFWRLIHYWVYPFFFLSLIHGLSIGSDSHFLVMQAVYGFTGITVILLTFYRIFGRNS